MRNLTLRIITILIVFVFSIGFISSNVFATSSSYYDPATNAYSSGSYYDPAINSYSSVFTIPETTNSSSCANYFDPATNSYTNGYNTNTNSCNSNYNSTSNTNSNYYDPTTNSYTNGLSSNTNSSGTYYDPATNSYSNGNSSSTITNNSYYDPATNSYTNGLSNSSNSTGTYYDPATNSYTNGSSSSTTSNGTYYDPATNSYTNGYNTNSTGYYYDPATNSYTNGYNANSSNTTTNITNTTSTPVITYPFPDIADHWAKDIIKKLYDMKVVSGYASGPYAGKFLPDAPITRAELVKIVIKLNGLDTSLSNVNSFPDVNSSAWYATYIAKAKELGVVSGYPDGNFRPNRLVNRAEAMKIILRATKGITDTTLNSDFAEQYSDADNIVFFSDVNENFWFAKYVNFGYIKGIIKGKTDGKFHGEDYSTRAEAAKMALYTYELNS